MKQQPHRTRERTKSKQEHTKSCQIQIHILLFDLAHKQCNGIIKGWFHCLMMIIIIIIIIITLFILGLKKIYTIINLKTLEKK